MMMHRCKRVMFYMMTALCGIACPVMEAKSAAPVRASVKPYHVSASLEGVSNLAAFRKVVPLSTSQRAVLAKNLFVAAPSDNKQLFHIYESNDYRNIPSFVSTDLVLQMYHIFYDFTLRSVEETQLTPALARLTSGMLQQSLTEWKTVDNPQLKSAAFHNVLFFGVAASTLGLKTDLPPEARAGIAAEISLISKHEGFINSTIFPYKLDYSQFIPRGHYTRTPVLRRYFMTMMWYGLAPFALSYDQADGKVILATQQVQQGLLWVHALYAGGLQTDWARIYEPTSFYVGAADDLTPVQWKKVMDTVFGPNAPISDYADGAKEETFFRQVSALPSSRIQARFGRLHGVLVGTPHMIEPPLPEDKQLRFMGQRYIPDSEVLQRLSVPIKRVFPSGLDVMAVLGSSRARMLLDRYSSTYNASHWEDYGPERAKLIAEFKAVPPPTWSSNLYWSWLHVLQALISPAPSGYPSFMQNAAWQDKSIYTALASWAELRHDTILYGKQSVTECGDGGPEPPFVKGYVEPNLLFYSRLADLTRQSKDGLVQRKLLSPELKDRFEEFESLLKLLVQISNKELQNQKLTQEEYQEIRYIGGKFEQLTLSVMQGHPSTWQLVSQTDKNMAVIADVHTGGDKALEEAVGEANEIYVIVPVEGKLELTRGAIFSYYEFKHPVSDRLTDEKWQQLLGRGSLPASPPWTTTFLIPGKSHHLKSSEMEPYSSGC